MEITRKCIICEEFAEDTFNDVPYCLNCWNYIEKHNLSGDKKELKKQIKRLIKLKENK